MRHHRTPSAGGHQEIHVDPEPAKDTTFGRTIARAYLTESEERDVREHRGRSRTTTGER
jgi:hypothetical protein